MAEGLGRVRSCTECRIQKLKCDAREDYLRPCTRCRKKNLSCEFSRGIQRSQRKTKAQLVRENASLQEQLRTSTQPSSISTENSAVTISPQAQERIAPVSHLQSVSQTRPDAPPVSHLPALSNPGDDSARLLDLPSVPRAVTDGFQVTSPTLQIDQIHTRKIHDCFRLFFAHYEPFIPGLFDPNVPPEEYYDQSPFLFWSIVATGARRYTQDPTLFQRVVSQVLQIALGTLFSQTNPIPSIEAVLILCLWPVPQNTMFHDSSHPLAGIAMQLAVQNGLHIFGREQDYSRQNINASDSKVSLRFRLWVHCVIIFQNTNLIKGFPCWSVDEFNNVESDLLLEHNLSPSLLYRYKLHKVQTDAVRTIVQSTQLLEPDCGRPLNSLIDIFDTQVRALVPFSDMGLDVIVQTCTRLAIRAFHFFAAPDTARTAGLVQLYTLSCDVLDMIDEFDLANDFILYSTHWLYMMVLIAAKSILRITRSELGAHVDLEHGENAYFKAIKFCRKRSAENNDLDSRGSIILSQLWANDGMFRKSDGTLIGDRLRLRSRLFSSVVFDTLWHWRVTFGNWKANPYKADDDETVLQQSTADQPPPVALWTPTSLFANVPPGLQPDFVATPSARNVSTLQPAILDVDAFDVFPDWEWAAELPLDDGVDLGSAR
ncbi:hypothetical protein RBB50_006176 [Rhinocladiella similis]